ncbi:unnamed protein product [Ectocarpus sp. 12 AP-2014]
MVLLVRGAHGLSLTPEGERCHARRASNFRHYVGETQRECRSHHAPSWLFYRNKVAHAPNRRFRRQDSDCFADNAGARASLGAQSEPQQNWTCRVFVPPDLHPLRCCVQSRLLAARLANETGDIASAAVVARFAPPLGEAD